MSKKYLVTLFIILSKCNIFSWHSSIQYNCSILITTNSYFTLMQKCHYVQLNFPKVSQVASRYTRCHPLQPGLKSPPVGRKVYGYISRLCLESSFPFFRSPGGAVKPPNVPCNVVYICVCVRSSNIPGGIDRISRYFTARRDKSTHLVIYVTLCYAKNCDFCGISPFFCAHVHNLRNAHCRGQTTCCASP